jgi:hypothetical protein
MYPGGPPQPFSPPPAAEPYPETARSPYPGVLPPPVGYRRNRRWPWIAGAAIAVAVIVALTAALIVTTRDANTSSAGTLTESSAKNAIQEYLDALTNGDDETVARHTLCGLFDDVKQRRSDLALASLSSDAFRKQYSSAKVTSIDKMVLWSPNQAQVLFTMQVVRARGSTRDQANDQQQAVAQLLAQDNETLVCSYLPRTAGQY